MKIAQQRVIATVKAEAPAVLPMSVPKNTESPHNPIKG
jgi:hypothetical protein